MSESSYYDCCGGMGTHTQKCGRDAQRQRAATSEPNLTAQHAQLLLSVWRDTHWTKCICDLVNGVHCRYPKPSALVAYEQAQAGAMQAHVGEPKPALAYVLTRTSNVGERLGESLRIYTTEARALEDLRLVESETGATYRYRVHTVPRVE